MAGRSTVIDAASIPVIPGDMDALAMHARDVDAAGAAIADTGADVFATWQGLRPVYQAPEAGQLFDATLVVKSVSASTGQDIKTAAAALLRYADEVRDIQARLKALQGRATEFEADMRFLEDEFDEQVYVDQNNELVSAVNAAVADFEDAQRRCASAINALYRTDGAYRPDDGDGVAEPGEFGATAAQYDAAGAPWGRREPDALLEEPVSLADRVHDALGILGFIPGFGEPADAVNAVWSATEGDYLGAGLSLAAIIPVGGWGAGGYRLITRGSALARRARVARKEAMRQFGIPAGARPVEQRRTIAGYQYVYEVPRPGGGTRRVAVTNQTTDRVEGHGPHWEVGEIKPGDPSQVIDPLGRYRIKGEGKVKVEY
jgi:hypothetical protein